jgi:hypothetical protein
VNMLQHTAISVSCSHKEFGTPRVPAQQTPEADVKNMASRQNQHAILRFHKKPAKRQDVECSSYLSVFFAFFPDKNLFVPRDAPMMAFA